MAKSLRSKWKRKMRAIKRVGMDEKVLIRMKKMLADYEKSQKEEELEKDLEVKENPQSSTSTETVITTETIEEETVEAAMEVEGDQTCLSKKKGKVNVKTMKNEDNKYPAWMSTKKIKRHARMMKKKEKRKQKTARMSRQWKIAIS